MKKTKRLYLFLFILTILAGVLLITGNMKKEKNSIVAYNEFISMVENKEVESVELNLNKSTFTFTSKDGNLFKSDNPKTEEFKEFLLVNDITVVEPEPNWFISIASVLISLLPTIFIIGFFVMLVKGPLKQMNPIESSKTGELANSNIKFDDIAANKECKKEMKNLVEFLKSPQKYTDAGAILPKGVIFYGNPGTGKTLMAKAIAGEAGVPFYSTSGSDFVEMYVGVGAKRVRDLFEKAKKNAPCVVFIDEIDAVGKSRGRKDSHAEIEQTINALLAEMDGFNGNDGILVIAATNRLDTLDSALLRAGRFDKHISIPLPDVEGRKELINLYKKNKQFSEDVDFDALAKTTIGFSGADIKTLLNEATILAVDNGRNTITNADIDKAMTQKVLEGSIIEDNKSRKKSEIELVAYHEAGHAIVTKLLTKDSVPKVTIHANTSGAGGVTFVTPEKEYLLAKEDIMNNICIDYAGRVAEKILYNDENKITTGASSDIKQASVRIKGMIENYGMNDKYGMLNLSVYENLDQNEMIAEAAKIAKTLYSKTEKLLNEYKEKLTLVAKALMEKETLYETEIDEILFSK